jgi:hypothetical protein
MSVPVNPDHVLQMSNVQLAFKDVRTAGNRAAQPGADPDAYVQAQWNTTAAILEAGGMPVTVTRGENPLDPENAEGRAILSDAISALTAKVSFIGNQPGYTPEKKRWLADQLNDWTKKLDYAMGPSGGPGPAAGPAAGGAPPQMAPPAEAEDEEATEDDDDEEMPDPAPAVVAVAVAVAVPAPAVAVPAAPVVYDLVSDSD